MKGEDGPIILDAAASTRLDEIIATPSGPLPEPPLTDGWHPCLKQKTRCVIVTLSGVYEATNSCHVGDAEVCPRVTAGCPTGEGYDLCGPPKHAEAEAAALVPEGNRGGTAHLFGHNWLCGPCQWALQKAGVSNFHITGEEA